MTEMPDGLKALIARAGKTSKPPPVDAWGPDLTGDLDMTIMADGTWHYQDGPITREALVRLFASILRKDEDGETYLVTPVERYRIHVEDAHFIAVELATREEGPTQVLTVRTNCGDVVEIGPHHPLRFVTDESNDGLKPYIMVRGRLEAVFSRAIMYDLVALAVEHVQEDGKTVLGVWSSGQFYTIAETVAQ